MKILWTGSDVMYMLRYPPFTSIGFKLKIFVMRIMVKLMSPFIQEHYVVSENLKDGLYLFGIKNVKVDQTILLHINIYDKVKHNGINVYYYLPCGKNNTKFIEWLYGYDIIQYAMIKFPEYNWIRLDGSADMSEVFPIMDFYVRPNRHDGRARLRLECEINKIPYYWSQENPDLEKLCETLTQAVDNKNVY